MERDWANLEPLPLRLILNNLEERIDHVWFGAVCKNWKSNAKLNHQHQNHQFKTNTLPMLLITTPVYWTQTKKTWWLYGIPNKRFYPFPKYHQLCLDNPKLRLCGSSHGWLAYVDDHDSTSIITLVNFFKDVPHITLSPLNSVKKVTMSSDPIKSPNNYVIVAIYERGNIAFIRRCQTFWTYVDPYSFNLTDVIFYKGLLFVVDRNNKIVSFKFDLDKKSTITSNVVLERSHYNCNCSHYLVKSLKQELWMVIKYINHRYGPWGTDTYRVYKLQPYAKSKTLEQMARVKFMEDNILFLGAGDSISVSASYFSKSLHRNSIYFAKYIDIYDVMSDKRVAYSPANSNTEFWILPNFQWN